MSLIKHLLGPEAEAEGEAKAEGEGEPARDADASQPAEKSNLPVLPPRRGNTLDAVKEHLAAEGMNGRFKLTSGEMDEKTVDIMARYIQQDAPVPPEFGLTSDSMISSS